MGNLKTKVYKPKQENVIKLNTFLKTIKHGR